MQKGVWMKRLVLREGKCYLKIYLNLTKKPRNEISTRHGEYAHTEDSNIKFVKINSTCKLIS